MRARLSLVVLSLLLTTAAFGKDVYLSVGGSVGKFRTDARIWNPSYTKDITITARYLPAGNSDNTNVATKTITLAKRTMAVYDDVVQSLFGGGPALGAVRLTSDDDFVATQRIYANETAGTLGQFVPGLDVNNALTKGVLIQLKQNGGGGQKGTFRTNWGGVNPNTTVANIHFELYDKDNTLAGTNDLTLQPFGVFSPTNVAGFFGATRDLSNGWISFSSDVPVFLYISVLDNGTEDPTFITASGDSGVKPEEPPPPPPVQKSVVITAQDFSFTVTGGTDLRQGDEVKFTVSRTEGTHGLRVTAPNGSNIINLSALPNSPTDIIVTLPVSGSYFLSCTNIGCGEGHGNMFGQIDVAAAGSNAPSKVTLTGHDHHHH